MTDFQRMLDTLEKIGIKFKLVETEEYKVIFINPDKSFKDPGICSTFYFKKKNNEKYLGNVIIDILDLHKE